MAASYVDYTGNGSNTDYTVPFPYIDKAHVHAYLNGVETTAFSWLSATQIRMTTAPANAVVLRIKRQSPNTARLVDFQNGSALNADTDLDTDSNQTFYLLQETIDSIILSVLPTATITTGNQINPGILTADRMAADVPAQVATVAALKALTTTPAMVLVLGYGAAGDGGGGLYRWNSSDVSADNAGTIIAPNAAGTGRWNLVTPYAYVLHVRDFGAKGDGVTDDYTAILNTLTVAATLKAGVVFDPATYVIGTPLVITGATVPAWIDGQGATIKAKAAFGSNTLVKVENPHSTFVAWRMQNLVLDGAGLTSKNLLVHGCQYATFTNIWSKKSGGYGIHVQGEPGFGVYDTLFSRCHAGGTTYSEGGASSGWLIESINNTGSYYVASVTLQACVSQFNKGHGYSLNYASITMNGCDAEINDLYGITVDNAVSVDVVGGYTENNHQNRATRADGTGDGSTDYSVATTANTTGFKLLGGRHIGSQTGTFTGAGNWWQPGKGTATPILAADGTLTVPTAIKGSGTTGLVQTGVTDATAPIAGQVGELFEGKQSGAPAAVNAAATGTYLALASIALTAGDWDIQAHAELQNNSATLSGAAEALVGTTTGANTGANEGDDWIIWCANLMSGGMKWPVAMARKRVQITAPTTYYLNVLARYSAGTPQWVGKISARRVR